MTNNAKNNHVFPTGLKSRMLSTDKHEKGTKSAEVSEEFLLVLSSVDFVVVCQPRGVQKLNHKQ